MGLFAFVTLALIYAVLNLSENSTGLIYYSNYHYQEEGEV